MRADNRQPTLTDVMLEVFRVNGRLLERGDRLVVGLGLTSARWQMLGALALGGAPMTAPQIGEAMGVSRQGAQKQLNLLVDEDLIESLPNPRHVRSPLYRLTARGESTYAAASELNAAWSGRLAEGFDPAALQEALKVLRTLRSQLEAELAEASTVERTTP